MEKSERFIINIKYYPISEMGNSIQNVVFWTDVRSDTLTAILNPLLSFLPRNVWFNNWGVKYKIFRLDIDFSRGPQRLW